MSDNTARLYLTTPQSFDPAHLAVALSDVLAEVPVACLRVGLSARADDGLWTEAVNHLQPVCHGADVALVVTDRVDLVEPLGLDGVHLHAVRTPLSAVRQQLGQDRIVGAFAGNTRHHGMVLAEAGADYISFGPLGGDHVKDEVRAPDALFQWWAEMIETPVVAEGGVRVEDAARLTDHADFVMPDGALWDQPDPVAAFKAYAAALA